MKYCSETVSRKIAVLSAIATVAVVIIHSNSLENIRDCVFMFWIGRTIAYLQHWAVPFFFMVSGFFFDRYFTEKSFWAHFPNFLFRKVKSLAVPYVLWGSVFGFITMTPLRIYVNHQHGDSLLAGTIFASNSAWDVIDKVLGISACNFVEALWYVRLLIIVYMTAPIWIGLRKLSKFMLLLIGLTLVLGFSAVASEAADPEIVTIGGCFISVGGIGWMLLGMSVSAFKVEEIRLPTFLFFCSLLVWVAVSAIIINNRLHLGTWYPWMQEWYRIAPIFLILFWWGAYDFVPQLLPEKLPEWFGFRFWTYCMHHPVTAWVGGVVYAVFGHGMCGRVAFQLLVAPITIALCLGMGMLIKRNFIVAFRTLNGGR